MSILNFVQPTTGNWLVDIIGFLINMSSSIAVGIILFTVILKLITLPFDFYSRLQMTKNSIKMEEMRPELERLQKQYANDKNLYNQKMMALYKKNGYSMFGSCLPTIITLVIFIIAINGFTAYSRYKNLDNFYQMSLAYNQVVYEGFDADGEYIINDERGNFIVNDSEIIKALNDTMEDEITLSEKIHVSKGAEGENKFFTLYTDNGYMKYTRYYTDENTLGTVKYEIIEGNLDNLAETKPEDVVNENNNFLVVNMGGEELNFSSYVDKFKESETPKTSEDFIKEIARERSAYVYRNEVNAGFLWVKNIWISDSPLAHPISENTDVLNTSSGCACTGDQGSVSNDVYSELISNLDDEKGMPNGYFILAILTAGISLLMQIITTKTQKAQMELQTVDGQGAATQKMMTWLMPIMFAIFAFMYTAAFSIYMIISSALSILTTLGINYIAKKKYKTPKKNGEVVRGRVFDEKPEVKPEKKTKVKKEDEIPEHDFLSDKKGKKRRK